MPKATLPDGSITEVTNQSRIVVDENNMYIYLSISYPDLKFPVTNKLRALRDIGDTEMFYMESEEVEVNVTLNVNQCEHLSFRRSQWYMNYQMVMATCQKFGWGLHFRMAHPKET